MNTDLKHSHPPHAHDQHHQDHKHVHSAPPGAEAAVAGVQWTCPMHPEILRDSAGDCPICGMALVPIAGTGMGAGLGAGLGASSDEGESDDSELRDLARRLRVGIALAIPLVVVSMSPMAGIHEPLGLTPRLRGWVEFLLGTPLVIYV